MGLASIYESIGKTDEPMAVYKKVLEIAPEQPLAANNLAWMIASKDNGDLGEALRLAMLAKQSLPEMPSIADTLGWVHYKRKSYSLAIAQYQQALEKQPNNGMIRYHLALAQYGNGDKAIAEKTLKEALGGKVPKDQLEEMEKQLKEWEAQPK
jgi:Flp pilus assembly protein TadD